MCRKDFTEFQEGEGSQEVVSFEFLTERERKLISSLEPPITSIVTAHHTLIEQGGKSRITSSVLSEKVRSLRIAGTLIFVFATQFSIVMIISESIYPGYSVANNYISDLGVKSTGPLFDTSISILGIAVIASSYFLSRGLGSRIFGVLVALVGIGSLCVGIFNESFGLIHGLVSLVTFVSGALAAIYGFRVEGAPMKYISVVLGVISLAALVISIVVPKGFGLGVGGIERMIVYPFLLWGIAFGGYLMGYSVPREIAT